MSFGKAKAYGKEGSTYGKMGGASYEVRPSVMIIFYTFSLKLRLFLLN